MKYALYLKIIFLAGILVLSQEGLAQYLRSSYFMEGNSRMQLNPALLPSRGYVNVPGIGMLNASVCTNSLGMQDFIDLFDSGKNPWENDAFYNKLKAMNDAGVSVSTDIISFGFYKGKGFWSVNVGVRADAEAGISKDMFAYLREKPQDVSGWDTQSFAIGRQNLTLNAYTEVGVGYARALNSRLTVGGKLNVLLGMANLDMNVNNVSLETRNLSSNGTATIDVDARIEANMRGLELTRDDGYDYVDGLEMNGFGVGGYGAGIDLGATYRLLDNLTLSAAVLDLGFISWSKSSSSIVEGESRTYTDRDVQEFYDRISGSDAIDFNLLGLKEVEVREARVTSLPTTLVLGAEYAFFNNKLSAGVLSTTRWGMYRTWSEFTLSANYRPTCALGLSVSYSMLQSAGKTFGVALKLGPLMVGTDYLYLGENTRSVNAFLGLSFALGQKRPEFCRKSCKL